MHPYRMQQLIKARGKDRIANVAQRNSVYQTIEALFRAGLIEMRAVTREENRPERTIYEATPEGREQLAVWLRTILSTPAREFPDFPAALSLLDPSFTLKEVASLLETRIGALEARRDSHEGPFPNIPRMFLLEEEYMAAMDAAEIAWLRGIVDDLRSGRLAKPTAAEMRELMSLPGAPSEEAVRKMTEKPTPARKRGRRAKSGA
jgi:DNA-binding PadR family transcriptional regulator